MNASTWVLLIVAPINAVNNYLLVWYEPISLGFIGAPIATSFTYWLQLALILLYIKYIRGSEAWGGWSLEAFKDWWPFIQLAIPGIFMVCSEWWSWVTLHSTSITSDCKLTCYIYRKLAPWPLHI